MVNPVQLFKALSDETRLHILLLLAHKNVCAKGISKHLNISEAAVSQHIKILKDAEIIIGTKQGYRIHYTLNPDTLNILSNFIDGLRCPSTIKQHTSCPLKKSCPKSCCHSKQGGDL